jgi:hypothetical protein
MPLRPANPGLLCPALGNFDLFIALRPFDAIAPGQSWPSLPRIGDIRFYLLRWGHLLPSRRGIPLVARAHPFAAIAQGAGVFPSSCAKATQCHRAEANYFNCRAAPRPTFAHLASNILQIASKHFGIMELHYYGFATSFSNAPILEESI